MEKRLKYVSLAISNAVTKLYFLCYLRPWRDGGEGEDNCLSIAHVSYGLEMSMTLCFLLSLYLISLLLDIIFTS